MTDASALRFEREVCSRCHGTGEHSRCEMYGTTCFKCHGEGQALTRRAAAARAWMVAKRIIKVSEIVPGMVVKSCGSTFNVQSIAQDLYSTGKTLRDGVMVESAPSWRIEGVKHSFVAQGDHTVELIPTRAEQIAQLAAAIEYQNTLPASGKPRARKMEAA